MNIESVAYEKYKADWLLSHRYSLQDFAAAILEYFLSEKDNFDPAPNPYEIITNWENDRGFGGEIYACFDEFLDTEFKDEDYMRQILTSDEFIEWQKYWSN